MEADLAELDGDLRSFLDRCRDRELVALPFRQYEEMVDVRTFLADEVEATACLPLQLDQPFRPRTDEERRHVRRELDAIGLRAGPCRESAKPAFHVERCSSFGDDDAVATARRTLLRHHLARPVGDILASHLDETERRNFHDVRLRSVALELRAQRFLDGGAVLRVRHVDEVDDDDSANVAQPQLADDFLHRFEVVLRDRVLQSPAGTARTRADETSGVDVDDRERFGVVEDEVAARRQVDATLQRRSDLRLDAERVEEGLLLLVTHDALDHVR